MDRPHAGRRSSVRSDSGGSGRAQPRYVPPDRRGGEHRTAANGDHVAVTVDEGSWFDASPKSVSATGEFTHFDANGNVHGAGTWTATSLISFDFYGCRFIPSLDVDLGDDNLCGGAVKMAVTLDTPIGQFPGMLTVFCIVGPQAPASHRPPGREGVTLNVPGIVNFNHTARGDNIYIRV